MINSVYSKLVFFHVGLNILKKAGEQGYTEFSSAQLPKECFNIKLKYLNLAEIHTFEISLTVKCQIPQSHFLSDLA